MISVSDLKQLIFKETGYKIQVQDNDPIFAAFYVNLATLGEALKHAEEIQSATRTVIKGLPGAADLEMKRAGEVVMRSLSAEVSKIAQRLANDSASTEKALAISSAARWTGACVLACAVLFGGTGYGIRLVEDELTLNTAKNLVVAADARAQLAEKQALEKIEAIKNDIGWLGTADGQLAKSFFKNGAGRIAATCAAPEWEIRTLSDGQYCIPNRRPLLGGKEDEYGWKIP